VNPSPRPLAAPVSAVRRRPSISLPPALLAALDAEAARQDRSRSWIVQQAVRAFLPKMASLPTLKVTR
jgi:uncharacterized small protein (TIGR04563 family)